MEVEGLGIQYCPRLSPILHYLGKKLVEGVAPERHPLLPPPRNCLIRERQPYPGTTHMMAISSSSSVLFGTGPRKSLSLKMSDARVYAPQLRAHCGER